MFKILKNLLFIFVIAFLNGCINFDALLSDTNNYDHDLTMERLAKSFGTKAYIPIGGCSLVNQPNSFGNVYRVCKVDDNKWKSDDKDDNNFYSFNEVGAIVSYNESDYNYIGNSFANDNLIKENYDNPYRNPATTRAIFKIIESQLFFLEAINEKKTAQAFKHYVKSLQTSSTLGEDNLEKIIVKTKEIQKFINKKISEGLILDERAKKTFSVGISNYVEGIYLLSQVGFSNAMKVLNIGSGFSAIINGIEVFFEVKDVLTAIPLFYTSTNHLLDFGEEHNLENLEELQSAKDSLGV